MTTMPWDEAKPQRKLGRPALRTQRLEIRLTRKEKDKLGKAADAADISMAQVISRLIAEMS